MHGKSLYRCKICRPLDNDAVTLVEQHLSNQVKRLLGTRRDQNILYRETQTKDPVIPLSNILSAYGCPWRML